MSRLYIGFKQDLLVPKESSETCLQYWKKGPITTRKKAFGEEEGGFSVYTQFC